MRSKKFVTYFICTAVILLAGSFLSIAIVDPNNTLALSPPLERQTASSNQRFSYPSIASSADFDSAIIGTSTTRMLQPESLNKRLKVKLANLSMNSATWWEQGQIYRLFMKSHKKPKLIIWGMDAVWCAPNKVGAKLTFRAFPEWLYDENKWNDYLHLLNLQTVELTGKQLAILLGLREARFKKDGYRTLKRWGGAYKVAEARRKIYGQVEPIEPAKAFLSPAISLEKRQNWHFPNLKTLEENLLIADKNTRIVLMMVPLHQHHVGALNGSVMLQYKECKKRVFELSGKYENVNFIDFMYRSPFTSEDKNYWDLVHYNEQGAKQIEDALVENIANGVNSSDIFRTALTGFASF